MRFEGSGERRSSCSSNDAFVKPREAQYSIPEMYESFEGS